MIMTASDHQVFDDDLFVEEYLLDRLSPEDAERFEQHYLDCVECLGRLETTQTMLQSLRYGAAQDAMQMAGGWQLAVLWRRLGLGSRAILGLGALVLILGTTWTGWRLGEWGLGDAQQAAADLSSQLDSLKQSAQHPLSVTLSPLRDASKNDSATTRKLILPVDPQWLVLQLELGLAPGTPCHVYFSHQGEVLWQREAMVVDGSGHLSLLLTSDVLLPGEGEWVVEDVTSPSEGAVIARFPLLVE